MKAAFATAVLVLSAGAAVADDAAAKRMLKDLEGSYTPVSMTRAGKGEPDEIKQAVTFHVKGDTFTVRFAMAGTPDEKVATIVLDPSQKPTAIDLTPKVGPDAGKPMLGIIKMERDTVTLCWADHRDKAERPKDFSSTKENKNFLIVMQKAK
jgi:uncharacterized protein (TIGR03067 family)